MVGQGVLRECLAAADVNSVIVLGRSRIAPEHSKMPQLVVADLFDIASVEADLTGIDACFFCLGVSSAGMSEADYRRITYDLTLTIATTLARLNPAMVFVYVSGAGTDSSGEGRTMWARVKGETENALKALPFAGVYLFRPGIIQPLHGVQSKTPGYQRFYTLAGPLLPLLARLFPNLMVTTEQIRQAMLAAARRPNGRSVVEPIDIRRLAQER